MIRILVISDDTKQREAIDRVVKRLRFTPEQVRFAESWDDAREAIREPFHLAVIDIRLWDYDLGGLELIRQLHERQKECEIIAVTEHHFKAGPEAMDEGARLFISAAPGLPNWVGELDVHLGYLKGLVERRAARKPATVDKKKPA